MNTNSFKDKDFFYPTSSADFNEKQAELFQLSLSENNPSTNIAVMGPMGAGKSSFIKTFDKSIYNSYDKHGINISNFSLKRPLNSFLHKSIKKIFYISPWPILIF